MRHDSAVVADGACEYGECFVCGRLVDNGAEVGSEVAVLRLAVDDLSGELRELSAALGRTTERVERLERRLEDAAT